MSTLRRLRSTSRKVVIVGGSHSGFSCAWLLLNGPAGWERKTGDVKLDSLPLASHKRVYNCTECCYCPDKKECKCVCQCLGMTFYDDWEFEEERDMLTFGEGDIKILYREQIKLFY